MKIWTLAQYPPGDCGLSFTQLSPPLTARLHERARVRMKTKVCNRPTINSTQIIHFFSITPPLPSFEHECPMQRTSHTPTDRHVHTHTQYLWASPWQARLLLGCPCALQESIKTPDFLTNTLLVDKMTSICCLSDVSGERYVFHEKIKNNGLWVRA